MSGGCSKSHLQNAGRSTLNICLNRPDRGGRYDPPEYFTSNYKSDHVELLHIAFGLFFAQLWVTKFDRVMSGHGAMTSLATKGTRSGHFCEKWRIVAH